ncbi:MAG: carboxymuconolactone decarboxylase family protein, partial [Myxococcales bacterium]|nr:carboxymuconolactone decarboxylase family protein [Myxococcales bacterium]
AAFSARERAALAFAEQVTLISQGPPTDACWAELAEHFSEEERVNLFAVLVAINGWNRIAVSFGLQPEVKGEPRDASAA